MIECEDYSDFTSLYTDVKEVEGKENTYICESLCTDAPNVYINTEG